MDIKKIGMIAGGGIGSFLVMIIAMYFLYPYINPEKKKELDAKNPKFEEARFDPAKFGPKAVDSLNRRTDSLQLMVDSLKNNQSDYVSQIDSLEEYIEQVEQEKEEIAASIPKEEVTTKDFEDVSKSLLNLDEDALAPIVNLLEDEQLVGLYNSASNMQRAKLLRTLKPDRAAKILKKVM